MHLSCTVFWVIASYLSIVANLTHSTCICHPCRWWPRSNLAMLFGARILHPWAVVRHYLRHSMFSHFDTIPECDRQTYTQTDDDGIYCTSIVLRGKNRSIQVLMTWKVENTRNAWQNLVYIPLGVVVSSPSEYLWKTPNYLSHLHRHPLIAS